jgi:hypothetical protein
MRLLSHGILDKIMVAALPFVLLIDVVPVMASFANQTNPASLQTMKNMAAAQHEVVVLLTKKEAYAKAMAEANEIFDMKWPDKEEPLLVKEMLFLTEKFLSSGQAHCGIKLIDENLWRVKMSSSQATLLKERDYLHERLHQLDH